MRFLMAVILTGMLVSCATMPETKIFSLYLPVEHERVQCKSDLSVHIFTNAPGHLSQPYIMHRSSEYELGMLKYSKWEAAPVDIVNNLLSQSLTPFFREIRITRYRDLKSYSIFVELRRFERHDEGNISYAELAFDLSLRGPDGKDIYLKSVVKKERLETKDSLNLAMAMSAALMETAEEIQADMSILMAGK